MNITQFSSRCTDDLSVIADNGVSVRLLQIASGLETVIYGCICNIAQNELQPSGNPQGVTVRKVDWNLPETISGLEKQPDLGDEIIDTINVHWKIIAIERRPRIGRVIYHTSRLDSRPRLDCWLDIVTPIYQTNSSGEATIVRYRVDQAGINVRVLAVPVSSHRQFTQIDTQRIEIVFIRNDITISVQQRLRLSDGRLFKPTDIFPATNTSPCLRVIAKKESE